MEDLANDLRSMVMDSWPWELELEDCEHGNGVEAMIQLSGESTNVKSDLDEWEEWKLELEDCELGIGVEAMIQLTGESIVVKSELDEWEG